MPDEHRFGGRATAPGSSRYYAVRMAPPRLRDPLALLFEWQWELRSIYYRCSDPGVALAKLQWYRDELPRALNQSAQHPLLIRLAETIDAHQLPLPLFLGMTDAIEMAIRDLPKEIPALKRQGILESGNLLQLMTRVCGGDEQELASASELGASLRLAEIICHLGRDHRLGACFLPRESMAAYRLQPARLAEPENKEALQTLLAALAGQAAAWRNATLGALPKPRHPALIPALALSAAQAQRLAKLERDGFDTILTRPTNLAPLQKLWISWRIYRRHRME